MNTRSLDLPPLIYKWSACVLFFTSILQLFNIYYILLAFIQLFKVSFTLKGVYIFTMDNYVASHIIISLLCIYSCKVLEQNLSIQFTSKETRRATAAGQTQTSRRLKLHKNFA